MIQGNTKVENTSTIKKYTGFTNVRVAAINPTRLQVNKMLGKEDSDTDKDIEYLSEDQEGNAKLRVSFWLHSEKLDKYFVHSINLINKDRLNKAGDKHQYVNSVCDSSWAENVESLPDFFTSFIKDGSNLGEKTVREAKVGEADLLQTIKSWLGRLNFKEPNTSVILDLKKLFKEDLSELRDQIDGTYATEFTALLGVKTDESDPNKTYQQVYGKFLPKGFMDNIERQDFSSAYVSKVWNKFMEEVRGDYGFDAYFEAEAAKEYDPALDLASSENTRVSEPSSAKY